MVSLEHSYNYILDKNIKQEYVREIAMMFFPIAYKKLKIKAYVEGNDVIVSLDNKIKTQHINLSIKNSCKKALYLLLKDITGMNFPYGILTGVKPLNALLYFKDKKRSELKKILMDNYLVSENKADLILDTRENESKLNKDLFGMYIHIPYCPSRCGYCSFPSFICNKDDSRLDDYTDSLIYELNYFKDIISLCNINTLYIGGGTASILSNKNTQKLLKSIEKLDLKSDIEFTFEAGRCDMLSEDKLKILKDNNVNRICINPQTFNEKTLKKFNRFIPIKSFYDMLEKAKKLNFECINSDLILGLTDSKYFMSDVKELIDLGVDNITLHTLSLKRASNMENMKFYDDNFNENYDKCVSLLNENSYSPYYLYKQKFAISGGENVGFFKDNKVCKYNILTMSGKNPILSFGAGGQSKFKKGSEDNDLIRVDMTKDPKRYIEDIHKNCEKKMSQTQEVLCKM